jgi:hypothetical protein
MARSTHPQRINEKLLQYWQSLSHENGLPAESEIDPDAIPEIWPYCFLVQADKKDTRGYTYSMMGEELVHACGDDWTGKEVCEALLFPHPPSLLLTFDRVVALREPHLDEGEFHNAHGVLVKYRSCVAPLSRAGGNDVAYILGAMRWKAY